ncbi:MAG: o-succinylbenzoate synthase [Ardenticatenaceae bacterium]|nr:o-succinylbenzoate synthase [Ardenticatenaceae bacterium]
MKIEKIELFEIQLPLVHPFRTSFGTQVKRDVIVVKLQGDGLIVWGECVASAGPWYSSETIGTAWHVMTEFLLPLVIGQDISAPADMPKLMKPVRGHVMAKAALENAVWTWFAEAENKPLSVLLGGVRERVEVGVSIGIQPSIEQLVDRVSGFVEAGYRRIKMKIEPGWLIEPIERIRTKFPEVRLMGDANSAFTLDDVALLKEVDPYGLLMLEQPLSYDDIADHARLQAQIDTPVCLDESIHGPADAQAMIDLKAGRIINLKVGRVGGFTNALKIHDMAQAAGIQMWCGGMLETGIGRAGNVHLATLPNFVLPGDISATERYYARDIANPPFVLNREDSTMTVPTGPGLGVEIDTELIDHLASRRHKVEG